ncbi:MAG: two-component system response regulator [Dehalococcoidia bacterium]|nr:two-component system response regulator [Dehalococcoidia bacterium]
MAERPVADFREREIRNLLNENRQLRSRVALLATMSRRITGSLDTVVVLQTVIDAACELTDARYGALGVFDEAGTVEQFITHGIAKAERDRIGPLPSGLGLLGYLHHAQQPVRVADLSTHPHSVGFPANHPVMKSFLGAPIRLGEESLGNIYLTEKQGASEFSPEDEELLILFASQAALAIHNARLHQRVESDRKDLFTERERLKALVETTPVGVFVWEAGTHRLLLVNQEGLRLTGAPLAVGDTWEETLAVGKVKRSDGGEYAPDDLPVPRAFLGERTLAEEMRLEMPGGHSVPVLVSATPVQSPEGSIVAAISVIQDMTPVEQLERLRTEFLGMVSHELKTPLTAIKGAAATVLGSKRPFNVEETRELFEIVEEQADRLRDLVDNLLDMTRIESGRLSVNPEVEDLRSIIEEVKSAFARATPDHALEVSYPNRMPLVQADRRRVVQVLSNLVSNSAKFSPEGMPIQIIISEDPPTHVRISIHDQGRGIPKEKQGLLFRKFSQVHEDSKARSMGTGLGLVISKGIVEAHGGRIWVESEGEGKGSTFTFTLPSAESAQAVAAPAVTHRSDLLGRVHKGGQRTKVLAVDDESQILRYLHRTLEEAGFHTVTTQVPDQVIPLLEREEPDLLLLDLNLPGTTGFDMLERIREVSGVPVIFLTADSASEKMVKALKMGADDYIVKPFAPTELLARIEAVLRRRLMADTVEVKPPFVLGDLVIQFGERRVTVGGAPVSLTATEYKLLFELSNHAGMVLTHDQILQRVWGEEYAGSTELLRSLVRNLRRKLGDNARNPRYILTETQVGYRMPKPPG